MIPLPQHLAITHGTAELIARMRVAQPAVQAYAAEIGLTYRGPQGRAKVTAAVVVLRPSALRYALYGPHGGVLAAFAMNAQRVTSMDLQNMVFTEGSATPENIDALMPFAPLGFTAAQWVNMLFGIVQVPDDATVDYDPRVGHFVVQWHMDNTCPNTDRPPDASRRRSMQAEVAPDSSRVVLLRLLEGDHVVSSVRVLGWNAQGLPEVLEINATQPKIALRAAFRDYESSITPDPALFTLAPAPGMTVHQLP